MEQAEQSCLDLLHHDPQNTDAYHCLGLVYIQSKRYNDAINVLRTLLQYSPSDTYAYFNLAAIFQELKQWRDAADHFRKAIESDPAFDHAFYNLGIVLKEMGEIDQAIAAFRKAAALNPNADDVQINLGCALREKGELDDALQSFRIASQLNPLSVSASNNLGLALHEKGMSDDAIQCFEKALALDPDRSDVLVNLGKALKDKKQYDDAALYFTKATQADPSFAPAFYNLGTLYEELGAFDDALTALQKAVILAPDFTAAHNNLAMVLEAKGDIDKAIKTYRHALSQNPSDTEIHWNLSHALLRAGRLEEGWKEYEWRFLIEDFPHRCFLQPTWDGLKRDDTTLLIFSEQGIGEEIMFASCIPEAVHRTKSCIVECDKRLVPLFARSFQGITFIGRSPVDTSYSAAPARADMRIGIGSLPKFFRTSFDMFPQLKAYLVPDNEKVIDLRGRLASLGNGLKIGISWRGGKLHRAHRLRSTRLEQWMNVFRVQGVHFINLQYGDCSEEIREAEETLGTTIHNWEDIDPLQDLDTFAAMTAALDLVISVDNATVHMASALGVPVWTLLPFSCDWRWMDRFEDTPWYPTMRLFRQERQGDWSPVFFDIAENLEQYLKKGTLPEVAPEKSYRRLIVQPETRQDRSISVSVETRKEYTCAVVTPVGPGHENMYQECLASVEKTFNEKPGNCAGILPVRIDDPEGNLGRSKARNLGIHKAAEQGAEWIFFLDADDLMSPSAFEYVSPYLDKYDAIWGSIWSIGKGETTARERPKQLPFLYGIDDVLSCDPFVSLQMGHFIKTQAALATLFDESLDTGEDFDYYLRVWDCSRCIKIPLPLFYNRRGLHSYGPRSATGHEWRDRVEQVIKDFSNVYFARHR